MYSKILLPVDGSGPSERASRHANKLATQHNAEIHLMNVVEMEEAVAVTRQAMTQYETLNKKSTELLYTFESEFLSPDVEVTRNIGFGSPGQEIISYATGNDFDLIVMGTHGRSGVSRVVFGSVTETVLRNVDVPVTVIPEEI